MPEYAVRARPGYFAPKPSPIKPTIEFTARDPMGRYLDVAAEDLEVVENGVPQRVEQFHEASQPLSLVLALDASGSMKKRETEVIESARAFVSALRPEDSLAVVLFSDRVSFAHDLSTNRDVSHDAIQKYQADGGTALFDAVSESLQRLRDAAGRRILVVMTDGRDENNAGNGPGSTRTLNDAMKDLKASGTTVFTIGIGTKIDTSSLEQLATLSGGRALFPQDVSQLACRVSACRRGPPPTVCRRIHVIPRRARRIMARGTDSVEIGARSHHSEQRRLPGASEVARRIVMQRRRRIEMRTSGAGGSEGWIMAIPIAALIVAASAAAGGPEALLVSLEGTVRSLVGSAVNLMSSVF